MISELYGQQPGKVIWHELSCQGILIDVNVNRNPLSSITNSVKQDYKYPTDMKTILSPMQWSQLSEQALTREM